MTERTPRGRPPVPLEKILSTAQKIVEKDGPEALSLRNLATRLKSGTATLYRHFSGRDDLVAQIVDRIFGEIADYREELNGATWQKACRIIAHSMLDVLEHHQGAVPLLLEIVPNGPNTMRQREHAIGALLAGGLPPAFAARMYTTLAHYVLGFAVQLSQQVTQNDNRSISVSFQSISQSEFPAVYTVKDELPIPLKEEFSFGLELMITGLSAQLNCAE